MAKGTYWLPKGTIVKWNDIEIELDDETNSVLVDDSDWPRLQQGTFPSGDWDTDDFPEDDSGDCTCPVIHGEEEQDGICAACGKSTF